ncbi:adenine phosphoribosyltransferase [Acidaminobacter sp.]|uniref:adenine phosphoribosyltransferase n=1 Tax=Acidaminobacter sp. TaxID=1872102 RepID=UPI00137C7D88|nr:adenine phosphoribosyltransferase [Acidaminobacter sp.]MDK9712100.1 adenine phosphoribosyltransferase [Acidaminobacter sp.]MZQ98459.1 adenine phosphoribosyltransferase [Acidaminobacter sp.]
MDLKGKIREIQDFPKEGISFKDVTTLLADGEAYAYAIDKMLASVQDVEFDVVLGPEARGFLIGAPIAYAAKKAFVPVRKPGKLPYETYRFEYDLEYGTDILEIHKDAIKPGARVLIADDLLATGGTVESIIRMVGEFGAEVVGCVFLIELTFLNGREKLGECRTESLVHY